MDRKAGALVLMGKEWRTDEERVTDKRKALGMVAEAWLIALGLGAITVFILAYLL